MRAVLRELWLTLALLSSAWTLWLVVVGGIDTTLFGVSITSNEPVRPFLLATLAIAGYIAAGPGAARAWAWFAAQANAARADWGAPLVLSALLASLVAWAGVAYGVSAVMGSDPYGYVSQADLWLHGQLKIDQPWVRDVPWPNARWTAAPLGYRPVEGENATAIVPTYSIGLPLLMAAAKAVFGHGAVYWIVPLSGMFLVLATFGIGQRLGSTAVGLGAAWFIATSPLVLFMQTTAMSDVPAAAAWATAFYFALRRGVGAALAAGLACSVAIAIRPNLVLLAVPIGALTLAGGPRAAAAWIAGCVPGVAAVAWVNATLYGSPLTSGYGGLGDAFNPAFVGPNLKRYLTWLTDAHTGIAIAGLAAAIVPIRRLWPFVRDRRPLYAGSAIVVLVVAQYLLYLVFDDWWFLRFWLPAFPFIALGTAALLLAGTRPGRPWLAMFSVWLLVCLGLYNLRTATKLDVLGAWAAERRAVDVADVVRREIGDDSLVYTMFHSGSLRYYGGRMTIRYDNLDREWLDKSVAWLTTRGIHPYALLEEWEVPQFLAHFEGQQIAADLEHHAVWFYRGAKTIGLYDLSGLSQVGAGLPRDIPARDPNLFRAAPPVAPPVLAFR